VKNEIAIDGVTYVRKDAASSGEVLDVEEVHPHYIRIHGGKELSEISLRLSKPDANGRSLINRMPDTRFRPGMKIRVAIVEDQHGNKVG